MKSAICQRESMRQPCIAMKAAAPLSHPLNAEPFFSGDKLSVRAAEGL